MGKHARRLRNVLCAIAGFVVVIILGLQIFLNSGAATRIVDKALAGNVDADVNWSRMHFSLIKSFPRLRVSIDSLEFTYPHDRFARFDAAAVRSRMLDAGRGETTDTLARFDHFSAAVNVWRIIGGKLRLSDATLQGLSLYAHAYDDSTANWNVFKPGEPKDTTSKSVSLPWISVGSVYIGDKPEVVYTAQHDTVYAALGFEDFLVQGDVKLGRKGMRIRNAKVHMDSLYVNGRLPADSVDVRMDWLAIEESLFHKFDLGLGASAMAVTNAFGRIQVPVEVNARVGFDQKPEKTRIDVDRFDANVAYIPLSAEGWADLYGDSTYVKASAAISRCELATLLDKYAASFVPAAADFQTDAILDLGVEAEGVLAEGRIPAVAATLKVPESNVRYVPLNLPAKLALDAEGSATPDFYVKAAVNELAASAPGFKLDAGAKGDDILGDDPHFKLDALATAALGTVMNYLPKDLGMVLGGNLNIDLDADATLSQIKTYNFDDASVNGRITGDYVSFAMPEDSLSAHVQKPIIVIGSGSKGILADIDADSVYFAQGSDLVAKVRRMQNSARLYKAESRGQLTPRLEFNNSEKALFMQTGDTRIGIAGAKVAAAAEKRVRVNNDKRRHLIDSLQRVYPGVPRNELFAKAFAERGAKAPDYLKDSDLASGDIDISLDSTITRYLRQWKLYGRVELGRGIVATPALPIRNRIYAFAGEFDGKDLNLDTLSVASGSSDVSARGKVTGIGRALMRKGKIDMNLDVHSRRININELLAAMQLGKESRAVAADGGEGFAGDGGASMAEPDESFVVDNLEDAMPDTSRMSLIIMPANVSADLKLNADEVNYTDITASPFTAAIKLQDRTLQLCNTSAACELGKVDMDAYYSTKSLEDISAGANIKLKDISAEGIIHLIPGVDDMMPALKSFKGLLGCDLSATTQLDTNMNVIIPTLDGLIRISGENLVVEDAGDLRKITRLLLFKNKDIGEIDNLYVDAVVHDSKVEVFPFELGVDRYKLALRGMQGLDKSMNYHVSILRSPFLVRFGVNLFGTLDNWRFNLTLPKYREGSMPQFTQELDAVQVNILESIRNIFQRGKSGVEEYNRKAFKAIDEKKTAVRYDDASDSRELSLDEYVQIDSLAFDYEAQLWEAELMEEIDDVLEESYTQMENLMKQYAEVTYDKSVERSLERMRKQEEKKAEKEAKKAARKN